MLPQKTAELVDDSIYVYEYTSDYQCGSYSTYCMTYEDLGYDVCNNAYYSSCQTYTACCENRISHQNVDTYL